MSISSTLVHRADIRFHEPPAAIAPLVGCFWIITAEPGAAIRVVPDGSTSISTTCSTDDRRDGACAVRCSVPTSGASHPRPR